MCGVKVKSIIKWWVCEYFSDRLWLNCYGESRDQLIAVFLWGLIVLLIKVVANSLIVENDNVVNVIDLIIRRQNKINRLNCGKRLPVWEDRIRDYRCNGVLCSELWQKKCAKNRQNPSQFPHRLSETPETPGNSRILLFVSWFTPLLATEWDGHLCSNP